MSYLNKYGSIWGQVPVTAGRVFFVAPSTTYYVEGRAYNASDSVNDGASPERALATVARALALAAVSSGNPIDSGGSIATTTTGDTIVLLPGTHTVTAQVRVQAAGVTITGCSRLGYTDVGASQSALDTVLASTGTSTHLLSIEASNVLIANLALRPTSAFSAVVFRNNPTVDNLRFKNVVVDLFTPAASTNTFGFDFANRADSATAPGGSYSTKAGSASVGGTPVVTAYLENVTIWARDGVGRGIDQATADLHLRGVWFKHTQNGTWATPYAVATSVGTGGAGKAYIDQCLFSTFGTMATCISGAFAGSVAQSVIVTRTIFPATTTDSSPMSRFASNVAQAIGCTQLASVSTSGAPRDVQPVSTN